MGEREFDVCLYGATGFTGSLVAKYMATKSNVKWAMAGRNTDKINALKKEIGTIDDIEVVEANSSNYDSILTMAQRCKVVLTTVGPYLKYGEPVVRACVEAGTHYCDLTGEFPFMREMIDLYHDAAEENKVKIVLACGYDCIPVDLGTYLLTKELPEVEKIRALCTKCNGLFSGGTLASAKGMSQWAKQPENVMKAKDPYVLFPSAPEEKKVDENWTTKRSYEWDSYFSTISGPYFMAPTDNRLVRRSLALRDIWCSYDEAFSLGAILKVSVFGLTHLSAMRAGQNPKPGEGPAESIRKDGSFGFVIKGTAPGGKVQKVSVHGKGDPGYRATATLIAETAMCLAFDDSEDRFGVLTPSTAMGDTLVERLHKTGQFSFKVL